MATPVGWSYGPWRTSSSATPYATVPAAAEVVPGVTSGQLERAYEDVGGGRGGTGITATGQYGPMTASQLGGMWGGTLGSKAIGMGLSSLVSGSLPNITPASFYGMAPKAAVTVASLLSSLFGGVRGIDESFGVPSELDVQTARDMQGAFAADALAAQRADYNASRSFGPETPQGPLGPASPAAGMANPDIGDMSGYGVSGMGRNESGGGEGRGESGGNPGGGVGAGGMGDAGGEYAKGGFATFRGPSRPLVGEAGEETGVFVPERWKRPGNQPREAATEAKMRELLRALRG